MESQPESARGRPRLFIQEMVMRNFKSYAGEQRVGPFHKVWFRFFHFLNSIGLIGSILLVKLKFGEILVSEFFGCGWTEWKWEE